MVLTVFCPDGSVLGQFAADTQDAEILAKRVHRMSPDRPYSRRVLRCPWHSSTHDSVETPIPSIRESDAHRAACGCLVTAPKAQSRCPACAARLAAS
ncbi:hypothetical protein JBE04_02170 [Streptomyces sp. PRKS01-29]|nr:hypothetical protein [Streptomyces sabulosicollis]MBI0293333.1 hypothetical protein [Streptomyces sabulosicollis]